MKISEKIEVKTQANNPLYGITLKQIVTELKEKLGWKELNRRVKINCFFSNPSIKSSLIFLRKTNWARLKVEEIYIEEFCDKYTVNHDFHESYDK